MQLADILVTKTLGNPFFLIHYLKSLYDDEVLHFDATTGNWVCCPMQVASKELADNAAQLMTLTLSKLSPEVRSNATVFGILKQCTGKAATTARLVLQRRVLHVAVGHRGRYAAGGSGEDIADARRSGVRIRSQSRCLQGTYRSLCKYRVSDVLRAVLSRPRANGGARDASRVGAPGVSPAHSATDDTDDAE